MPGPDVAVCLILQTTPQDLLFRIDESPEKGKQKIAFPEVARSVYNNLGKKPGRAGSDGPG